LAARRLSDQKPSPFGAAIAAVLAAAVTVSGAIGSYLAIVGGELASVALFYFVLGALSGFSALFLRVLEKTKAML
jgi:hypothetical protein